MPSLTFPPGLSARQKRIYAAAAICKPCCGSGGGSGSPSVSPRTVPCNPGSDCSTITVPNDTLTLSINETNVLTTQGLPLPTGDYTLTWQENILVAQDLDQSEVPCLEINQSYATGYMTDEIFVDNYFGCDVYIRYSYDICTGILSVTEIGCIGDCPDQDQIQFYQLAVLTIVDCDPYYAELNDAPDFVGSISV